MQCLEMDGGVQVPLVNRQTWKAVLPKCTEPLPHPITHVRFTYEDLRKYNDDMFQMMPDCQRHYMETLNLPDVPWNFLVGPGGIIVEGRGWHSRPWRPEEKFPELKDKSCLDIAYIGDYSEWKTHPTWEMLRSGMYLIMHGLKNNYISSAFETIPYRDKAARMLLELDEHHSVNLVGRGWWGAEDVEETTPLEHPITWVRFTYEDIMSEDKDIIDSLIDAQLRYLNDDNYTDIPYNFIVDVDGTLYEGRGWKVQGQRPAAFQGLDRCLDICYVGDYKDEDSNPPYEQMISGMYLVMYGLKQNFISPRYNFINWRDKALPVTADS